MNIIKRMIKRVVLAGIAALSLFAPATAQDNTNKLTQQFNQYQEKVLQEKLFMHTDKDFYLAGDILWFRLYYVDAAFHQSLNVSKVAYIEILGQDNKPVLQSKTALKEGSGKGSLYLPVNINSGVYIIRAYTNSMKNFGADQFFEKRLVIVNPQKKRESAISKKIPALDIQFFPEGGSMVYGINSRVACKVTDHNGKGIAYDGSVIDEQDRVITSFHSSELGMCNFEFNPSSLHRYKVMIDIKAKEKIIKELPAIQRQGYVMRLEDKGNAPLTVTLTTNIPSAGEVYLFAHTRQSVKAAFKGIFQNGEAIFTVDKTRLGDGISHFTVFNKEMQPLCERLFFKYPENKLDIILATDKTSYEPRTKINIDIRSNNQLGKPVGADMSMAVYRIDSLQGVDEMTISNYLLLTSDLKGYVESPSYYFTGEQKEKAVDDLMLTQGWRRFRWPEILAGKTPDATFQPEYNGHVITGKIFNVSTGAALANNEVYLSVPGPKTLFYPSLSDAEGRIKFEVKKMEGSAEIIVQPDPLTDSLARIEISNPFFEQYTNNKLPEFRLSNKTGNTLTEQNISTQVQNIYSGDKLKQFVHDNDSIAFYEKPDAVYFLDDYTRFTTMEEVMREYVGFMDVIKKKDQYGLSVLDMSTDRYFEIDPLILVDGVPVFSPTKLMSLDPLKFRKLEVVNRRYFLGNTYFNGILNWKSFKSDLGNMELDPHATVIDYEGLQLEREFYSPVYDTQEQQSSHLPDFRNLLYWAPSIRTSELGKTNLSFYTSDRKGKYVAAIQGLTSEGKCGNNWMFFEVK
jgi:hypothetical protein